ncbi:hypothetical protein V6N13_028223 [Hibiscus sabdariffa]|uniref:SWIM-type domain-containing protein n=1 Tax=Hibiscus sabdariffa TaxID=183260 RepID=A0ABR2DCQ6_9ROSI
MINSTHCRLVWNGDGGFEVIHLDNQHTIDMKKLTYTCREWKISGIQCCHVICAMYHDLKSLEDYVYSMMILINTNQNLGTSTTSRPITIGQMEGNKSSTSTAKTPNTRSTTSSASTNSNV